MSGNMAALMETEQPSRGPVVGAVRPLNRPVVQIGGPAAPSPRQPMARPWENPLTDQQRQEMHTRLVRYFESTEEATTQARQRAERDRDYYDCIQWTSEELRVLEARGQPPLTISYMKDKIEVLRGIEQQQRTDPKAYPTGPRYEQDADAATQTLRFVANDNSFDEVRSEAFEFMLVEGTGGIEVSVEEDHSGQPRIRQTSIPWDRLFADHYSRRLNYSDARYKGIVVWMDADEAREAYPGREDVLNTMLSTAADGTYGDKPIDTMWRDGRGTRVRVVQVHYRDQGVWWIATITKAGFLTDPQPSPYLDRFGKPTSLLFMRSAYMDRHGNRYGFLRDLISLQDEVNKRRSKALHWANSNQVIADEGALTDVDEARRQLARPDGIVIKQQGLEFTRLPGSEFTQAQMALLQHATGELQQRGANASLSGTDPRALSGRAIQAQQQGGAIAAAPLFGALRAMTREIFEGVWMAARQFFTEEKFIRITDDDRNVKFVGLNRKITVADMLADLPDEQRAQAMEQYGFQGPEDPRMQDVVKVENDIGNLDADIAIEEGPDVATLQIEQFDLVMKSLPALAAVGISFPAEAIIQMSQFRNKDKILDLIEKAQAAGAQQQDVQAKMALEAAMKDIEKTAADTDRVKAQTELDQAKTMEIGAQIGVALGQASFAAPPAQPAAEAQTFGEPQAAAVPPPATAPGGMSLDELLGGAQEPPMAAAAAPQADIFQPM